jgi:hypothetical protein
MRPMKALCGTILLFGVLAAGSAAAGGVRFGFNFGFPLYYPGPYYYPPPAYYPPYPYYPSYYPPVVSAPVQPPVYIERGEGQAASEPAPESFWYYCPDSSTYYPYVKECASTWQRVSPRPPGT